MTADEVRVAVDRGERRKFLLFWGHRPRADGRISSTCFSQWYAAAFTVEDARHTTAEHFMMAAKAKLFGDAAVAARVLQAASPGAAKAIGREVAGVDEGVWVAHRSRIVVDANLAKFGQNADICRARAMPSLSRRARWIGLGASVWPPTIRRPRIPVIGRGSICSGARS